MKRILGALVAASLMVGLSAVPAASATNPVPNASQTVQQKEQVENDCEIRAFRPYTFRQGVNMYIKFRVAYNCWPVPRWILVVDQPQKLVGSTWKNTGKAEIRTQPKSGDTIVATIDCGRGVYRTMGDLTNEKGDDHSISPIANLSCDV